MFTAAEVAELEALYGSTDRLPKGPEGKIMRNKPLVPDDFMHDEEFGDGVEFEAVELPLYGRGSL